MQVLSRQERVAECVRDLTSKPEFPAFSRHVQRVLSAVNDSEKSARDLTDLIIRDYSLTLRVLRAANSCSYYGAPILSITRAVVQLGTEAVRNLASSLLIFEHFHNKPAAIRELMMLSMLSANHVQEIIRILGGAPPEEGYLCGMIRNLGEVLIAYYRPAQYAQILELEEKQKRPLSAACLEVLQFSFEDLGTAIARYWGMPDTVCSCQQQPAGAFRGSGHSRKDILHAAVSLGHLLTVAVYRAGPEGRSDRLKSCLREYSAILPLSQKDVEAILDKAIDETKESFATMRVSINELRLRAETRNALESLREVRPPSASQPDTPEGLTRETCSLLAMLGVGATPVPRPAEAPGSLKQRPEAGAGAPEADFGLERGPSEVTLEKLTKEACSGLDSPSNFDLTTFIQTVLEAIYRGIGFDRVLFGFVNPDRTHIEGRLGLGEDIDALIAKFRFRLSMSGGPVPVALLLRRPITAEAGTGKAGDITELFGCSYLALHPVLGAGKVVGCLYMESRNPRPGLTTTEQRLLEQLRDALATAIERQRSGNQPAHARQGTKV